MDRFRALKDSHTFVTIQIQIPDGPQFIIACPQGASVKTDVSFAETARWMAYGLSNKDYFINLDDEAVPEREIRMTHEDCAEMMPPHDLGDSGDRMPGHE